MPVPCSLRFVRIDLTEVSLVENIVRMPMHPADQFEAFRDLIDKGASVPEVAARFRGRGAANMRPQEPHSARELLPAP
jgi:hypothetical protein